MSVLESVWSIFDYLWGRLLLTWSCIFHNLLPFQYDFNELIELSLKSMGLLSWLFRTQHLPRLVSFWCMCGGSVEVWTKSILYWFIKGQTHFGMPVGAKMNWPKMYQIRMVFIYIQTLPPSMHDKWEGIIESACKTINGKSEGTNSRRKSHRVKG